LRLDLKLNLYNATTKTHDNVFKKTVAHLNKKHEDIHGIYGKKLDK